MTEKKDYLVFVSHSSVDTWVAKQIAAHIEETGASAFLDEADIEIGADFEENIRISLEKASELVVLLTPWALERPYVWAELGAVWGRKLPIIAILHGMTPTELQSKSGIPVFLKKRDLLTLNEIDSYFNQLKKRINLRHENDEREN